MFNLLKDLVYLLFLGHRQDAKPQDLSLIKHSKSKYLIVGLRIYIGSTYLPKS